MSNPAPILIELGGREYAARVPSSFPDVTEPLLISQGSPLRGAGAMLGLAIPGLTKVTLVAHRYDYGSYGGAVVDALHRQGVSVEDILDAVRLLIPAFNEQFAPTEDEVAAAEDFTEAGEDPTPSP